MFTSEDYLLGWSVYVGASLVVLLATWRLARIFPRYLTYTIVVFTAAVLFTPFSTSNENYLAPAWLMAGLELVDTKFDFNQFWRAGGTTLMYAVMVSLLVFNIFWLLLMFKKPVTKSGSDSKKNKKEPKKTPKKSDSQPATRVERSEERIEPTFGTNDQEHTEYKPFSEPHLEDSLPPEYEPLPEMELIPEPEPIIEPESETELIIEPELEPIPDPEPIPEPEFKPQPKAKPQPQADATSAPELESPDAAREDATVLKPFKRKPKEQPLVLKPRKRPSTLSDEAQDHLESQLDLSTNLDFDLDESDNEDVTRPRFPRS